MKFFSEDQPEPPNGLSPSGWTSVFTTLEPGQDFPAHFHRDHEEIIIVTQGEITLWDRNGAPHPLSRGHMATVQPPERHYVRNTGTGTAHLVAIKIAGDRSVTAEFLLADRTLVDWLPTPPPE